ncbi:MAG: hypothetical protein II842_13465 [Butyrivibrio sp.]|nr:hypothetical protein [Butyrivibrio sp.]
MTKKGLKGYKKGNIKLYKRAEKVNKKGIYRNNKKVYKKGIKSDVLWYLKCIKGESGIKGD